MNAPETKEQPKRPASHKWAILIFFATAGVNIMLNLKGNFDFLGVIVTFTSVLAFVASLFKARSTLTYTIDIVALALVFLRALQSLWLNIADCRNGISGNWPPVMLSSWGIFLLFLLLRSYTLGTASRRYYGLPAIHNNHVI